MNLVTINNNDLEWAITTAKNKTSYTFDSWKKRSVNQRFLDIFIGDLAKNIIKTELIKQHSNIKKYLFEYDKERIDGFKKSDQYDLQIRVKNQHLNKQYNYSVEVKSSFERTIVTDTNKLFKNRNIIFNKNNIHENSNDFVFQVYYLYKDTKKDKNWYANISDGKREDLTFDECIDFIKQKFLNNVSIYVCGFASKTDLKNKQDKFSVENQSKDDKKREYLVYPLNTTTSLRDFTKSLKKYHTVNVNNEIEMNAKKLKRRKLKR